MFMLRLPRAPETSVRGGARLAAQDLTVTLDGAGVLRFMPTSLSPMVAETDGVVSLLHNLKLSKIKIMMYMYIYICMQSFLPRSFLFFLTAHYIV